MLGGSLVLVLGLASGFLGDEEARKEFAVVMGREIKSRADMAQRDREMAEWLAKWEGQALGQDEYLKSLALYFGRKVDEASAGLLAYLETHEGFPSHDYDTIVGRVFLNAMMTASRDDDLAALGKSLELALTYYEPRATVYRGAARVLAGRDDIASLRLLKALVGKVLEDDSLDESAKLELLRAGFTQQARERTAASRTGGSLKPFVATTMGGKEIKVPEDYAGKVLLVDFWATWCGPCVGEMPNVVKARKEFGAQGFEVVGVSLDNANAESKIRAMEERLGMDWPQIYDGKGWKAELAVANGVSAIPATFLFDKQGKLCATNLRGEALAKKVKELLAEK
ncbi:MAG: TlpA family protein disulfide reductase [Planctomycetes bacterium]|nr:TlpA family protein disulfide reductase [Planctomycetota bacterium]